MRLAIRVLGLDLLALSIATDDETCGCEGTSDLGSDSIYSSPSGALGFTLPSTDYSDGDE